jgi:hypothetical protein
MKAEALFEFFNGVLGTPTQRQRVINLDLLDMPQIDLSELSARFTEEEVPDIIRSLPSNKAPASDGFPARFLQLAWGTIRTEVMLAFDVFWHLDTRKFHVINEAIMVLLPKCQNAESIKDYSPISIIHVLGKLFSKVPVNRLAPPFDELIHVTQSAFVNLLCSVLDQVVSHKKALFAAPEGRHLENLWLCVGHSFLMSWSLLASQSHGGNGFRYFYPQPVREFS